MKYQNRFVIFIDILGFKEKIKNTVNADGSDNLALIGEMVNAIKLYPTVFDTSDDNKYFKSRRVTQFSDSIIISFELNDPADWFYALINTRHLILELVYKGFLCRGGMTYGKMVHTKEYLFGPAVIDAYELETKGANYPRVIVSNEKIVEIISEYLKNEKTDKYGLFQDLEELESLLKKDFDGLYYLDYFFDIQSDIDEEHYIQYFNRLKKIILDGLSTKNEGIKVKYSWMREKYNLFVKRATSRKTLNALKEHSEYELLEFCKALRKI